MTNPYTTLQPLTAWRALRRLLRDKEDTSQVFIIVSALTGKSLLRAFNRFSATQTGRVILAEERNLVECLQDRDALRQLPPGSLGRAYLDFVERENLSADGLIEASETGNKFEHADFTRYSTRLRDSHDLWHVLTGYGRDGIGELCLLGFTFAQTLSPGIALIALAGALKYARAVGARVFRALGYGYRSGRRAAWLPAADWEALLGRPIDEVRTELGIRSPEIYPSLVELIPAHM